MDSIQKDLLLQIADLHEVPAGAYNVRANGETQGSILIISHQERILNIADRIVVIADGQIQNQGEKDELLPQLLRSETCKTLTDKL